MKCGSTPAPGTVAGVVGFVLQRSPVCFGLCTGPEGSPALNEFSVFFGCLPLQGPRGHLEGGYIWKEALPRAEFSHFAADLGGFRHRSFFACTFISRRKAENFFCIIVLILLY